MGADNDLLIGMDDVAGEFVEIAIVLAGTDVVDTFEDDEPTQAGLCEDVAIEPR